MHGSEETSPKPQLSCMQTRFIECAISLQKTPRAPYRGPKQQNLQKSGKYTLTYLIRQEIIDMGVPSQLKKLSFLFLVVKIGYWVEKSQFPLIDQGET